MKHRLLAQLLTGLAVALGTAVLIPQPSPAGTTIFYCGKDEGAPATIADRPQGKVTLIRWVSQNWGAQWSPQRRCEVVSDRLQTYHEQGVLNYLTHGMMNDYPVLCVARFHGGDCDRLLFTLSQESDPHRTVRRLFNMRDLSNRDPLEQSSPGYISYDQNRIYIDVNMYLETVPVDGSVPE